MGTAQTLDTGGTRNDRLLIWPTRRRFPGRSALLLAGKPLGGRRVADSLCDMPAAAPRPHRQSNGCDAMRCPQRCTKAANLSRPAGGSAASSLSSARHVGCRRAPAWHPQRMLAVVERPLCIPRRSRAESHAAAVRPSVEEAGRDVSAEALHGRDDALEATGRLGVAAVVVVVGGRSALKVRQHELLVLSERTCERTCQRGCTLGRLFRAVRDL